MRYTTVAVIAALCAASVAAGGEARTTFGDVPRTYNHYLNAQEAALCRANAATGELAGYFLNPASASEIKGAAGQATIRYNVKSRDYLPDDGPDALEAEDDGFLFSQFVAARRSGVWTLGFGYSAPAYRDVRLDGFQNGDGYVGEFQGSLRYFEAILASRIGSTGQGGIALAAGLVTIKDTASETVRTGSSLEYEVADLSGTGASYAIGFVYDVTPSFTVGLGHRWGSTISVEGQWYDFQVNEADYNVQPTSVAGVRFRPTESLAFHASYIQDGWGDATAEYAPYIGPVERDLFDDSIGTAAAGVEVFLADERFALRAGVSSRVQGDIDNAVVPDLSLGFGGSLYLQQYYFDAALVRETFERAGSSEGALNYGLYLTAGYDF